MTELQTRSHSLTVAASFLPPNLIAQHLDRPITTALSLRFNADRNCRLTVGQGACVAFLDEIRREFNLRLDTAVDRMVLIVQMSFTDRQSFVGLGTGSTQFHFGVAGRFTITQTPAPFG